MGGFEKLSKTAKVRFLNRFCYVCPVRQTCDDYAEEIQPFSGLYGGFYWVAGRKRSPYGVRFVEDERDERDRQKLAQQKKSA